METPPNNEEHLCQMLETEDGKVTTASILSNLRDGRLEPPKVLKSLGYFGVCGPCDKVILLGYGERLSLPADCLRNGVKPPPKPHPD